MSGFCRVQNIQLIVEYSFFILDNLSHNTHNRYRI